MLEGTLRNPLARELIVEVTDLSGVLRVLKVMKDTFHRMSLCPIDEVENGEGLVSLREVNVMCNVGERHADRQRGRGRRRHRKELKEDKTFVM